MRINTARIVYGTAFAVSFFALIAMRLGMVLTQRPPLTLFGECIVVVTVFTASAFIGLMTVEEKGEVPRG